ncbi:MAG: endolytic transglycosylase MltG, partial [Gemmatimonadales bacterium]
MRRTMAGVVLWAGFAACGVAPSTPCNAGDVGCVAITIPRGATLRAATDSLVAHRLVNRRGWFVLYARLRGLGSTLKSGSYAFHRTAGWREIVDDLKRGRGSLVRFTVREGLMLFEVADLAARQLGVSRDSFRAAAQDPLLLRDLGVYAVAKTAEGYLYPTTYTVRPRPQARELVRLMADEFLARWPHVWRLRAEALRMSRHQVVTLASIIEAEVRYAPDRHYVSSVYHNRLKRGMLLQADPTVVYALGRRPRRVYEKTLLTPSPYNTYLHPGLPPGPISQPDSASLD